MTAAEFAKLADAATEFEQHPGDRPSRQLSHRVYAERQRIHRALLLLELVECDERVDRLDAASKEASA